MSARHIEAQILRTAQQSHRPGARPLHHRLGHDRSNQRHASGRRNQHVRRTVRVELTVEGCPLSQTITNQINGAVASYPDATLIPSIEVGSMSQDKLTQLVAGLKRNVNRTRSTNPASKPASSPSPPVKAAWANRLSPPIWQPHSRRSATIPPPSTPTSTVSRCPGYSACNHSPRTSTAC